MANALPAQYSRRGARLDGSQNFIFDASPSEFPKTFETLTLARRKHLEGPLSCFKSVPKRGRFSKAFQKLSRRCLLQADGWPSFVLKMRLRSRPKGFPSEKGQLGRPAQNAAETPFGCAADPIINRHLQTTSYVLIHDHLVCKIILQDVGNDLTTLWIERG